MKKRSIIVYNKEFVFVPIINKEYKFQIIVYSIKNNYSFGTSIEPSFISSITSCGFLPSIVHPTECAVPNTSLHVPPNDFAIERGLICLAIAIMSSMVILPLCLTTRKLH